MTLLKGNASIATSNSSKRKKYLVMKESTSTENGNSRVHLRSFILTFLSAIYFYICYNEKVYPYQLLGFLHFD